MSYRHVDDLFAAPAVATIVRIEKGTLWYRLSILHGGVVMARWYALTKRGAYNSAHRALRGDEQRW